MKTHLSYPGHKLSHASPNRILTFCFFYVPRVLLWDGSHMRKLLFWQDKFHPSPLKPRTYLRCWFGYFQFRFDFQFPPFLRIESKAIWTYLEIFHRNFVIYKFACIRSLRFSCFKIKELPSSYVSQSSPQVFALKNSFQFTSRLSQQTTLEPPPHRLRLENAALSQGKKSDCSPTLSRNENLAPHLMINLS